jgi:3-hydroxyacyl-CoA dehydrogenase
VKKFLSLDFETLEYIETPKPSFSAFEKTKGVENLGKRTKILFEDKGKAGEFYRTMFYSLFQFVSNRIPEIADEIYKVDDALNAGFGWKLGPFQTWDALGLTECVSAMELVGKKPAKWIYDMLERGAKSFYKIENGKKVFYDIKSKSYLAIPGQEEKLSLNILRNTAKVWENTDATIINLGDGVLNVEFH